MEKISIVISVMNRTDRIIECLSSWVDYEVFDDIVLVDWSSSEPILHNEHVSGFCQKNKKINIIRVNNQKYFSLPKSYNVAINNAVNNSILKIDIDHILISDKIPETFQTLSEKLDINFYCCEHVTVEHWGICFFGKDAFKQAGKYDERLSGWGYDDQDLYNRLSNIRKKNIMRQIPYFIYHNPHGDDLRVANYEIKNKFESNKLNELIVKNNQRYE